MHHERYLGNSDWGKQPTAGGGVEPSAKADGASKTEADPESLHMSYYTFVAVHMHERSS